MSARKFNLSSSLQGAIPGATPPVESDKVLIERIKASGSVDTARMEVIQEAFKVLSSVAAVFEAREKHKHAKVEWAGRVDVAKAAVEQAANETEAEQSRHSTRMAELGHLAKISDPIVRLFNEMLAELDSSSLDAESRMAVRRQLLELAPELTKLKG